MAVHFALPFVLHNPSYIVRQHAELWEWSQRDVRLHTESDERAPRDGTILCRTWLGTIPSTTTVRCVAGDADRDVREKATGTSFIGSLQRNVSNGAGGI